MLEDVEARHGIDRRVRERKTVAVEEHVGRRLDVDGDDPSLRQEQRHHAFHPADVEDVRRRSKELCGDAMARPRVVGQERPVDGVRAPHQNGDQTLSVIRAL